MKTFLGFLVVGLIGLLLAAKIIFFELPTVQGADMAPTLQNGDLLLACRFCGPPQRGALVLFTHPQDGRLLIRRVVGLPNESVSVQVELLTINKQPAARRSLPEIQLTDQGKTLPLLPVEESIGATSWRVLKDPKRRSVDFSQITLGEQYFVMADNRNHGTDSRTFGPVPAANIRAIITHRLSAGPGNIATESPRPGFVRLP